MDIDVSKALPSPRGITSALIYLSFNERGGSCYKPDGASIGGVGEQTGWPSTNEGSLDLTFIGAGSAFSKSSSRTISSS